MPQVSDENFARQVIQQVAAAAPAIEGARSRAERKARKQMAQLLAEPHRLIATSQLIDEIFHFANPRAIGASLRQHTNAGSNFPQRLGLRVLGTGARLAPKFAAKRSERHIQKLARQWISTTDQARLLKQIGKLESQGLQANISLAGESTLGPISGAKHGEQILELIARAEVKYLAVKASALVAPSPEIDLFGGARAIHLALSQLMSAAAANGVELTLDLESFEEMPKVVLAFKKLATDYPDQVIGIALQAYLPESQLILHDLIGFAQKRSIQGGAPIKVRLVKGANLSVERVTSELNGWLPAPYETKAEVDANYLRLVELALAPAHQNYLRVAIASHNPFHVQWAEALAKSTGATNIEFEFLFGFAASEARAIAAQGRKVLIYLPVATKAEFTGAIAYLLRRLDEQSAPQNYLHRSLVQPGDKSSFELFADQFQNAVFQRHQVLPGSNRHDVTVKASEFFENESNADLTDLQVKSALNEEAKIIESENALFVPLAIAGTEIETPDYEVGTSPNDLAKPWYRYSLLNEKLLEQAIAAARIGYADWSNTPLGKRRELLYRAAAIMQANRAQTAAIMAKDVAKSFGESNGEISEAIDFARYYADLALDSANSSPMGVVVVASPWNFPYSIPAGGILAALAAGNAVILKPAPEAVATAWMLVQQLWGAGIPSNVLQFLPTRDDLVGKALITHHEVDAVVLTGAFGTARLFTSWRPELHLLAETSGKNTVVVTGQADLELAASEIVKSAFGFAGQKCSAASLVIATSDIYDRFCQLLLDAASALTSAPAFDLACQVTPLISAPTTKLARALTTLDDGEEWLLQPIAISENLYRPGIKINVQPGSATHLTEFFGPLLGVMRAKDLNHAINLANQTEYGLTAGLFTLAQNEAELWLEKIEAGNLYLNRGITGAVVSRQPFGGWKRSSVGPTAKAGGPNYVNALRHWRPLKEMRASKWSVDEWWVKQGSIAQDFAGLASEHNYFRYCRPSAPITVRIDETTTNEDLGLIKYIAKLAGTQINWSHASSESIAELVASAKEKVRWLSSEVAPAAELLDRGITLDARPVAQRGDIEAVRWVKEQSISIAWHRYGNLNLGPKPRVRGLGELKPTK